MVASASRPQPSVTQAVRPRLAAVVHRLSPYHRARFDAARDDVDIVVVEANGVDATYDWDAVEAEELNRTLLFPGADVASKPSWVVRRKVRSALTWARPDVALIPGWGDALALCSLSWCLDHGVPTVLLSDSTAWDSRRHWWREAIKSRLVRLFDTALVAGQPQVEYVVGLGFDKGRVFTGCDVVDNEYFRQGAEEARQHAERLRRELDLPERYLLTVSRFVPRKNLERLLTAYSHYRATARDPAGLVVLGSGPLRERLLRRASELGIERDVHFRGFAQYPELPHYYGLADAFVLSSTADQWGLVVNEAMACSLPVIVSNRCGCARDLVAEGKNGTTFDPERTDDIADALTRILSPDTDRSAMGRQSQQIIAEWSLAKFRSNLDRAMALARDLVDKPRNVVDRGLLELTIHR